MNKIIKKIFFIIGIVLFIITIVSISFIMKLFRVRVTSGSMIPTIKINEQLLVKKISNPQDIATGSIIVFLKDKELLVKRLIGKPGDIVDIREGTVFINGEELNEEYVKDLDNYSGSFFLGSDDYFVLGDNRSNSYDARYWEDTFIHSKDIKGIIVAHLYPTFRLEENK